jgi:hypothetical protein
VNAGAELKLSAARILTWMDGTELRQDDFPNPTARMPTHAPAAEAALEGTRSTPGRSVVPSHQGRTAQATPEVTSRSQRGRMGGETASNLKSLITLGFCFAIACLS